MRPMFFGTLLYNLADQLVGLFQPLFLFEIGQRLSLFSFLNVSSFIQGILFTVAYYLVQRVVVFITVFPAGTLMCRLGYIWSMVIGTLFLGGVFIGFRLAQADPRYLILSFVCGGLNMVLYWTAHDSLFADELHVGEIGRGVGALALLTRLIQITTPAVSGFIIMLWGYNTLFSLSLGFLFFSCVPYFFIPPTKIRSTPSFMQFLTWIRESRFQRFALAQFGKYMDIIAFLLWPVYVLVIVGKIERVGYLFSLVLFFSLILTYVTGWIIDRKKGKRVFLTSGVIVSINWVLRFFAKGIWDLVGVEMVGRLAGSVYSACYDSFLCKRSKGRSVFPFHIYKEFILSLSAIILWSCAFVLFLLPFEWTSIFLLGAVGVILSLFLDAQK